MERCGSANTGPKLWRRACRAAAMAAVAWACSAAFAREPVFLAGADMSHLRFFEDRGVVYRENGQPTNAFDILRRLGLNCVRLRLFTSSAAQAAADPYNAINNLDYTLPLARRARAAGHQILLNFHYSDSWADPGKQRLPAAWTNLSFSDLLVELRAYNSNVLARFAAAGIIPEYVQVGNEITQGMLWPHGHVGGTNDTPLQWARLGQLLRAAIQGIRDAVPTNGPQIMIHIDRGGDWAGTRWFFDRLQTQNVPFDLIGLSYYPFWHGSLNDLRNTLTNAALRYRKPIVVVETAFPFSGSTNVWGIPATTNGQVAYVIALAEVVNAVPLRLGRGIFWWGAEYQAVPGYRLGGFDLRSLFGPSGEVLPAAAALGRLTEPLRLEARLAEPVLHLSWPLSGAGLSLVSSPCLAPPSPWQPVEVPVLVHELQYEARIPLRTGPCFFGLQ